MGYKLNSKFSILGNIINKGRGELRKLTNVQIKRIIRMIVKIEDK